MRQDYFTSAKIRAFTLNYFRVCYLNGDAAPSSKFEFNRMRKRTGRTWREGGGGWHIVLTHTNWHVSRVRLAGNLTDKLQRSTRLSVERCAISWHQQTMSRHELLLSLCAINNIFWSIEFSLSDKSIQSRLNIWFSVRLLYISLSTLYIYT